MLTAERAAEEVELFRERIASLYADVQSWILARGPATFAHATVELSEESPGEYDVDVLEVTVAGGVPVRFVPKSLFVLGSRGQVDVTSRFGSRMLVWVDGDGPPPTPYEEEEMVIGRPIYPGVPRGWAWADPRLNRLVHLTEGTLWDHVLARLVR